MRKHFTATLFFPRPWSLALLLCFVVFRPIAQPLPPTYYRQQTDFSKAKFLTNIIHDSLNEGNKITAATWAHIALPLAQATHSDSLTSLLYQYLGDAYDGTHNDSAVIYYRLSLSTLKYASTVEKIYLLQSLLYSYTNMDNKDSMLVYIRSLEQLSASMKETDPNRLTILNSLATSYESLNNYPKAIQLFRSIIHSATLTKDSTALRNAFINLGTAYNETGNDTLAITYTLQGLRYLRNANQYVLLTTYGNLCNYYASLGKTDSARIYLKMAQQLPLSSTDVDVKMSLTFRLASILVNELKFAEAAPLLEKTLAYYRRQPLDLSLINTLLIYAQMDTGMHNYSAAKTHLLELHEITRDRNLKAYHAYTLQLLSIVYSKLGDYKTAFDYQSQYLRLNDTLRSEKAEQAFAELQSEYEAFKNREQLNRLSKESRIKDLKLEAEHRNRIWYISFSALLLLALGGAFYFRQLRNKTELQQVKTSLEMKALRSQMNPHFIFNSLNSIQKYIWENKQEDAAEYLTRFARLIRLVLENSQQATVSLAEDLAALRLYIDMEHRRNNQKFDYSISLAEGLDAATIQVPPLLLQPFVENAIWHGLSQKDDRGKLAVTIHKEQNFLICTISDDGIGRIKAAIIKGNSNKKSLGMNISAERIAWLNKDSGAGASVAITDLYDDKQQAAGTAVSIRLPLILKHD